MWAGIDQHMGMSFMPREANHIPNGSNIRINTQFLPRVLKKILNASYSNS